MERVSRKLNLPMSTWGTACILFHKVAYASALPHDSEVSIYALSCLFLAAKVTDNPRDLGSVAQAFIFDKSGIIYPQSDPKVISGKIAEKEFEILCTLNFDLTVELAFGMLPPIKHHFWHRDAELLFKKAEAFLTECYRTSLCIRHPPRILALIALALAADFFKVDLQAGFRFDSRSYSTEASSVLSDPEDYENERDTLPRSSPFVKIVQKKESSFLVKRPPEIMRPAPITQPKLSTPMAKVLAASSCEKEDSFEMFGSSDFFAPQKLDQVSQTCVNFHLSPIKLPMRLKRHKSEVLVLEAPTEMKTDRGEKNRPCKQWYHIFGNEVSLELIKREMQFLEADLSLSVADGG